MKGWRKIFHENGNQKKSEVAVLISDKIDFKTKTVIRGKESHIMISESIPENGLTLVNIYAPSMGAPKYIRQILTDLKGGIDSNTIIVGDFNIPLSQWIDDPDRKQIRKHWTKTTRVTRWT